MVYAGSDWIKSNIQPEMSALGERVADLLGDLFCGIYHLDHRALRRVDWGNDHHIIFSLGWQSLSTYDNDLLTQLVILCHDRTLRCSISGNAYKYLELMFHQRQRDGGYFERHPTIEDAILNHRKHYGTEVMQ